MTAIVEAKVELGRESVTDEMVAFYRENGFVKVPNLLTKESAAAIREDALVVAQGESRNGDTQYSQRLTQQVNVWRNNATLRDVVLSPEVGSLAEALTGVRLRIWHDHLLSKKPKNGLASEWHQDRPFWPFLDSPETISVWIALQDTPVDLGCMSFIPKSQRLTGLKAQNLGDARSLFDRAPELEYEPKVTLPLRAGDATFHNGYCAHMAGGNLLDDWRVAMVTIYMQDGTRYFDRPHVVTDTHKEQGGLLKHGDLLDGELFPLVTA